MISAAIGSLIPANIRAAATANPPTWLIDWLRSDDDTESGVTINAKTVLTYAPVWMGVNKICSNVAQLPFGVFERTDDRESMKRPNHPGSYVLDFPNDVMDASVFREVLTGHAILQGNGRAYIERDGRNNPLDLIPLLPDRTRTVLVNDRKWHLVTNPETGEVDRLPDADVLHICGFGFDGIQGYSLVEMARNSIGLGLASEKHANRHFRNNAIPSLILEAPTGVLKKESEAKEFLRNWNDYHQGLSESNKTALLREGVKATQLGMTGQDAQWIEQRKFQRQEAALWLALEQILGDDSSVSYNSLEQKNMAYLVNCLMRWLVKWEQQCNRKLLTKQQQTGRTHYFKFTVQALMRATTAERYTVYASAVQNRILSPNECRALEDLPPYKGGDSYENPAITVKQSSQNGQKTGAEPPPDNSKTATKDGGSGANDAQTLKELADSLKGMLNIENLVEVPSVHIAPASITIENRVEPTPVEPIAVAPDVRVTLGDECAAAVRAGDRQRIHQLITARLADLVRAEVSNAVAFASKPDKFSAAATKLYTESQFAATFRRVVRECGGTDELANQHLRESLDVLGSIVSTAENLEEAVRQATENWGERAGALATVITSRKEAA